MGFDESNIKKFGFKKSDWNKAAKAYNETLDGGDEGVCGEDSQLLLKQMSAKLSGERHWAIVLQSDSIPQSEFDSKKQCIDFMIDTHLRLPLYTELCGFEKASVMWKHQCQKSADEEDEGDDKGDNDDGAQKGDPLPLPDTMQNLQEENNRLR
jgi:hypothetical protein